MATSAAPIPAGEVFFALQALLSDAPEAHLLAHLLVYLEQIWIYRTLVTCLFARGFVAVGDPSAATMAVQTDAHDARTHATGLSCLLRRASY